MSDYENLKTKIKSRDFKSQSDARLEISRSLIKGQISNEEHMELRLLLIETYKE